ncbi:MAG: hypothetical protein EBR40_10380, partial [Proteobacteria bacterium]|nr:hypothetical protein [Pseudomonadota bacterium]
RAAGVDTKFARQGSDWVHIPVFRGDAPYQPALFSPVYEVEHLSEHSDPHGRITAKGHSHRRDKVGFRVVGNPVAYANYDDKAWGDL